MWCFLLLVAMAPAFAQVDLVGEWGQRQHEDQPERAPGPELGDYLGLPINAAARATADASEIGLCPAQWRAAQRKSGADRALDPARRRADHARVHHRSRVSNRSHGTFTELGVGARAGTRTVSVRSRDRSATRVG